MNNKIINRHKARWCEGCTEADSALNDAIENFNDLVDNRLSPSVHSIEFSIPLDYDIQNKQKDNVLISDISRGEQIKDLKLMHVKLDSKIDAGSYVWWNNFPWIVLNEENNAVQSHKTYSIQKCGIEVNIQYDGNYYTYPVAITNLTLYADGSKELVNLTLSSAKYSIQIAENEVTNTLDVGSRFIIRGRAFEVSLVDDFTTLNVRTLTVCETVANSLDDLENDVAYNDNSESEDIFNPNIMISGNDVILIGDTVEYTLPNAKEWLLEGYKGIELITNEEGRCVIKCTSDSGLIGKIINLQALNEYERAIDTKEIRIGGLF